MTGIIVVGIIALVIMVVAYFAYRTTRPASAIAPRRSELDRANRITRSAQTALYDVQQVLDDYRPLVEEVGASLIKDVTSRIQEHDRRMLEENK